MGRLRRTWIGRPAVTTRAAILANPRVAAAAAAMVTTTLFKLQIALHDVINCTQADY